MTIRVLSGALRGRRLLFPKTKQIRPATARLKKMIFDTLGHNLEGQRILDLYAGTGSLGIEALSLGASHVTFVDKASVSRRFIEANLEKLGCEDRSRVIQMDGLRALRLLEKEGQKFDIVFADPPYNKALVRKTLMMLDRSDILPLNGRLVTEYSRQEGLPPLTRLNVERTKKLGITCLSFLVMRGYLKIGGRRQP